MGPSGLWSFSALDQGVETLDGTTVPFDAFVNIEGEALQHGSRPDLRPFNKVETAKDLMHSIGLQNMLLLSQMVCRSALLRTETRGSWNLQFVSVLFQDHPSF